MRSVALVAEAVRLDGLGLQVRLVALVEVMWLDGLVLPVGLEALVEVLRLATIEGVSAHHGGRMYPLDVDGMVVEGIALVLRVGIFEKHLVAQSLESERVAKETAHQLCRNSAEEASQVGLAHTNDIDTGTLMVVLAFKRELLQEHTEGNEGIMKRVKEHPAE